MGWDDAVKTARAEKNRFRGFDLENLMSRRAALKVLAAGAVLGCSPDEDGPLQPIVGGPDASDDSTTAPDPVSYVVTEQLQDINGDPAPGRVYLYGLRDGVVHLVGDRQVGEDGYFTRIPVLEQFSDLVLVGFISSSASAVTSVVSFTPLIDFSQDGPFVGPLHLKVLRRDQIPAGFNASLFRNYLQNVDPVQGDGLGVTHAFQLSVKDDVVTDVSGNYLRPFKPEIRGQFTLFIPEISFGGFPLIDLPEGEYVINKLEKNLRKFFPDLEVEVGKISGTGGVRISSGGVYKIDPGYFLISLERVQWQQPDGASVIPIETAIEDEFQGELQGAFGTIKMTERLTVELLDKIVAKASARCVGLTGTAPLATPPSLTILTHAQFHHESPDEVGEAEIMAFTLANAYPARRGANRRQPIDVLGETLPLDGQSVSALWGGSAAAGVSGASNVPSAASNGTMGIRSTSVRAAPLPVRTNLDGSYEFGARDMATALDQNFEAAGWRVP